MIANPTIDFNELDSSILEKIPLSLQIKSSTWKLDDLPKDIQYLIKKYYEFKVPEISYSDIYDVKPNISQYSDFDVYTSKKDLVLNLFKNFLLVQSGSCPFDVVFGNSLKKQLQTKDTSLRYTYITNEAKLAASILSNDYSVNLTVKKVIILNYENITHTDYYIKVIVNLDDSEETVTV